MNNIKRLPANRTKCSPTIRKAISWWNSLTYPQRYDTKKLCYPEDKTIYTSDKQKDEMYNLLATR